MKNEKGSVTVITLMTVMFLTIVLASYLTTISLKRKSQLVETKMLQNAYDGDMEAIYNEQVVKTDEPIITAGIATKNSTAVFYKYRSTITKVMFENKYDAGINENWDISVAQNKKVMAYVEKDGTDLILHICKNTDKYDKIKVIDLSYMFDSFTSLKTVTGLAYIDSSETNWANSMFNNCISLETIDGISTLNTSNIKSVEYMFAGCKKLQSINLNGWNL
jgi:surface protein